MASVYCVSYLVRYEKSPAPLFVDAGDFVLYIHMEYIPYRLFPEPLFLDSCNIQILPRLLPQIKIGDIVGCRFVFTGVNANVRGDGHGVAHHQALADTQGRQLLHQTGFAVRRQPIDIILVIRIGQSQGQEIVSLGEDGLQDFRRALA